MPRTSHVIALAVVGLLLVAADDDAAKDDEKLKGTWTFVSLEAAGESAPAELIKNFRLTFDSGKYTQTMGEKVVEEGTYKLDPGQKPKTMDLSIKEGPDKGKTQRAIYELDGETLRICAAMPDAEERPKEFSGKAGSNGQLMVLKRVKE